MTGYQVETVKSGNSIPCECMAKEVWAADRASSAWLGPMSA